MKKIIPLLMLVLSSFTVGTNAEFPPYCFIENGKIVGFDIDIAREVAARLGKDIELKDMPFEALIPDLMLEHVDFVAAGMSYSPERAKNVLFTKTYLDSDPLLILSKEGLTNLEGKKVAVNEGFTADLYLSDKPGITLVRLAAIADGFLALKTGRVDAFVTQATTFANYPDKTILATPIEGTGDTCALVVPKTKPELLEQIQKALDAMQADGTVAKIKAKWNMP